MCVARARNNTRLRYVEYERTRAYRSNTLQGGPPPVLNPSSIQVVLPPSHGNGHVLVRPQASLCPRLWDEG